MKKSRAGRRSFPVLGVLTAAMGLAALVPAAGRAATVTWEGDVSSDWHVGGNWVDGVAPGQGDDVVIDGKVAFDPTLSVTAGAETNLSLSLGATSASVLTMTYGDAATKRLVLTGDCTIGVNGTLRHGDNSSVTTHRLNLLVGSNLTVEGSIDVNGLGYDRGQGPGVGGSYGDAGSHGGLGAWYNVGTGPTYGSLTAPVTLGSGGNATYGGEGGGAVILVVSNAFVLNGSIEAEGYRVTDHYEGGAGGAVFVTAGTLAGSGTISVNGETAQTRQRSGGGGGRIAVVLTTGTGYGGVTMTAFGGGLSGPGAAGTLYLKAADDPAGELIVDNGDVSSSRTTSIGANITDIPSTLNVTVTRRSKLEIGSGASLSTTNGVFAISTNAELIVSGTLDMTDGRFISDTSTILTMDGGTLLTSAMFGLTNTGLRVLSPSAISTATRLTLDNVAFTCDAPLTLAGDLRLMPGTVVTHSGNTTAEINKLTLNVGGRLTIDAGAAIDVTGKGYTHGNGPGAGPVNGQGGSYGGLGANVTLPRTYGSVTSPTNIGSGAHALSTYGCTGGGAAILSVTDTLTLDGDILADGEHSTLSSTYDAGAGGSVFIRAGSLAGSGSGRIAADGGTTLVNRSGGGGGRVAIILTNGTSFSAVTNITALGGNSTTDGGAGTVYLKAADDPYGQLWVNNGSRVTTYTTLLSSNVTDVVVGDVVVTNNGKLRVGDGYTLTVTRDWPGDTDVATEAGSAVSFGSTNEVTVYGATTFSRLSCTNAGKRINFEAGQANTVTDGLTLEGADGDLLLLRSTVPGTPWGLNVQAGAAQAVSWVSVQDSDASGGQTIAADGSDNVGNNTNWSFGGATLTWTGLIDTDWGKDGNWSPNGVPTVLDTAVIPDVANDPVIDAFREVKFLTIETGGALSLAGRDLTVHSDTDCAGTLSASGAETVTFKGDVSFSNGTFAAASCLIVLPGGESQSVSLDGNTVHDITIAKTAGSVTFEDAFTAHAVALDAPPGVVEFRGNVAARDVTLRDAAHAVTFQGDLVVCRAGVTNSSDAVTFTGSVTAEALEFHGCTNSVTFSGPVAATNLVVMGCSNDIAFSAGFTVGILRCEDNALSLQFEAGQTHRATDLVLRGSAASPTMLRSSTGGASWRLDVSGWHSVAYVDVSDSDASSGRRLYALDSVDSSGNTNWNFDTWLTWDGSLSSDFDAAANWTPEVVPSSTNRVRIDGNYANAPVISSPVTVKRMAIGSTAASVLTANAKLSVVEGLTVGRFGALKHGDNTSTEINKLDIEVGADMAVDAGGKIDLTGLGLDKGYGSGSTAVNNIAGSHGGVGSGSDNSKINGSVTNPVSLGSGGNALYGGSGGGAARLTVVGGLVVHGTIRADGEVGGSQTYDAGAGGSILVRAGALRGDGGTITTRGGTPYRNRNGGGGGRIAIVQTADADFGSIAVLSAAGGGGTYKGAAGTVYLRGAGDPYGVLRIDNLGQVANVDTVLSGNVTDIPGPVAVVVDNRGRLEVDSGGDLDITGRTLWLGTNVQAVISAGATVDVTGGSVAGGTNGRLVIAGGTLLCSDTFGLTNVQLHITAPAVFSPAALLVLSNVLFTCDAPHAFSGAVRLKSGVRVTHSVNYDTETYKAVLTVGDDLTIESGACIDVTGKGYARGKGPGAPHANIQAGSHGGLGAGVTGPMTYGSIFAPTNLGSGGSDFSTFGTLGGGVAILTVANTLTLDGAILADGEHTTVALTYDAGAGGSVQIRAGALAGAGAGTIAAEGGTTLNNRTGGGGGRVAIVLTASDDFSSVTNISAAGSSGYSGNAAAGTIYRQAASAGTGAGTLTIDNRQRVTGAVTDTELPPALLAFDDNLDDVQVAAANKASVAMTADETVSEFALASGTDLDLNGWTLTLYSFTDTDGDQARPGIYTDNTGGEFTGVTFGGGMVVILNRHAGTVFLMR